MCLIKHSASTQLKTFFMKSHSRQKCSEKRRVGFSFENRTQAKTSYKDINQDQTASSLKFLALASYITTVIFAAVSKKSEFIFFKMTDSSLGKLTTRNVCPIRSTNKRSIGVYLLRRQQQLLH
jgi:hypothetical protein